MSVTFPQIHSFFPFWGKLSTKQQRLLENSVIATTFPKGHIIHANEEECLGILFIQSGLVRSFILSETGREVTLYRLLPGDICLFSASCNMQDIQFDLHLEFEKDTDVFLLDSNVYQQLIQESVELSNYCNNIMSSRFSEVIWILEQILFQSMDSRMAKFLLEQFFLHHSHVLHVTHEQIAQNIGSVREVVSRLLKYFQKEGYVALERGKITLIDLNALEEMIES